MRPFFAIILFLFSSLYFSIQSVSAYESLGAASGFANDYTSTLSAEEKQTLENKLVAFEKETGNEIALAMIASLGGDTIENFAEALFREWGVGKEGKDNGVLVLIAKDDRQMRIEVGYGLEGNLTDAQSFAIIEKVMKPAFRSGDYYGGISQAIDKIILAIRGEGIGIEASPESISSDIDSGIYLGGFFSSLIFVFMWLMSILGRSKSWWLGGIVGALIGIALGLFFGAHYYALLIILVPLGLFLDFIVSRVFRFSKSKGYTFGRTGGGRSGGGFGGFGGGGSGGGGASGRW
jgi:uncharacterized protein